MQCPYCSYLLNETTLQTTSEQEAIVHECLNCGGHWFPRWLANDINLNTAKNIDSVIPKNQIIPPNEPRCPECQNRLIIVAHDSVAQGITVLSCPQGHGNFFPKGNLYQFKRAQEAKITYHQVWGIPIKSALAVLLPVIAVITIAAGTPVLVKQIGQSQESRTKASSIINQPFVTQLSPTSAIISFTSTSAVTTSVTIYQENQIIQNKIISSTPKTTHSITIENLLTNTPYTYIINYSLTGEPTQTSPSYPLLLQ